jgi:hypothetical protein
VSLARLCCAALLVGTAQGQGSAANAAPGAGTKPDAAASAPAAAPLPPLTGVIRRTSGDELVVQRDDGSEVSVHLLPDTMLSAQQKASFADIRPNDFVASAAVLGADGRPHSQEVRIFPESMRGLGEGHRPMALPNQTMTNAKVTRIAAVGDASAGAATMTNATVKQVSGGVLTTVYPGGSTDLVVDPATPVWRVVAATRAELTAGRPVRVFVRAGADGVLAARYVSLL